MHGASSVRAAAWRYASGVERVDGVEVILIDAHLRWILGERCHDAGSNDTRLALRRRGYDLDTLPWPRAIVL